MKERIFGILDENSAFGRFTGRCWLVIATNLLFLIFCIPVVTIGPALAALFHVHIKFYRSEDPVYPVKEFWRGFRSNFKQALISWIIIMLIAAVILVDISFCKQMGTAALTYFMYANYFVGAVVLMVVLHLYPVMASFSDTIPGLTRNAVFFAAKSPLRSILILILGVGPMILTYMDLTRLPLYAFLWCVCGFGLIAHIISKLLVGDFSTYLGESPTGAILEDEDIYDEDI